MILQILDNQNSDFDQQLSALLARQQQLADPKIERTVLEILHNVRMNGDAAVLDYTRQFDAVAMDTIAACQIPGLRLQQALSKLPSAQRDALTTAAERIQLYAEQQQLSDWSIEDNWGNRLGQQIRPLERVGIYVPGGKAAYPSSVLMNSIPAKVAGVKEIVMVVPTPAGEINEMVLAAAALAEIDEVYTLGGAQAIAALAYGTESIKKVDKIVGPGNQYVATAKRLVFGIVGIDMIAGPSEIVIVADKATNPDWIALDLFSQAEHDEAAQAILITADADCVAAVTNSIHRLLPSQPRREIIQTALQHHGAIIKVESLPEAIALANRIAPEHLELAFASATDWLDKIQHAGAIFVGAHTAEAMGDYCAGPNHVLPTAGTARFASPLGVYDFQKRSSVIHCSTAGAAELARIANVLATGEGLHAHAAAANCRIPALDTEDANKSD